MSSGGSSCSDHAQANFSCTDCDADRRADRYSHGGPDRRTDCHADCHSCTDCDAPTFS
jgi:hypothetical protein